MFLRNKEIVIACLFGASAILTFTNISLSARQTVRLVRLERAIEAQVELSRFWEQVLAEYPNGV